MTSLYQQFVKALPGGTSASFFRRDVRRVRRRAKRTSDAVLPLRAVRSTHAKFSGLIKGAVLEHLREALSRKCKDYRLSRRRFTMRNEFRFPKATAVLMMIILGGIVLALEKARTIQASFSGGNPLLVPMEAAHLTFFPTLVLLLVIFYAARTGRMGHSFRPATFGRASTGCIGWRAEVSRLAQRGQACSGVQCACKLRDRQGALRQPHDLSLDDPSPNRRVRLLRSLLRLPCESPERGPHRRCRRVT